MADASLCRELNGNGPLSLRRSRSCGTPEDPCNLVLMNYKGPNRETLGYLTESGYTVIGSGYFGIILAHPEHPCVIKLPFKECDTAKKEFETHHRLYQLIPDFEYARIPIPILYKNFPRPKPKKNLCQLNMERIFPYGDTRLLYQLYLRVYDYSHEYREKQIRGHYIGVKQAREIFGHTLNILVEQMARLLARVILIGRILPRDLEWVVGRRNRDENIPCGFLIDYNEVTNFSDNHRQNLNNITKDLIAEPYWPHPESLEGRLFWNVFQNEGKIIQERFDNGTEYNLSRERNVYTDADINILREGDVDLEIMAEQIYSNFVHELHMKNIANWSEENSHTNFGRNAAAPGGRAGAAGGHGTGGRKKRRTTKKRKVNKKKTTKRKTKRKSKARMTKQKRKVNGVTRNVRISSTGRKYVLLKGKRHFL